MARFVGEDSQGSYIYELWASLAKNYEIPYSMWITIIIISLLVFFLKSKIKKRNNFTFSEIVSEPKRGTRSERALVSKLIESEIPEQTIFHDLYIKKYNGTYTQIDLVIATKVGILVFEVKDYSGWIFGTGYKSQWSQVLAYGREKYYFYNPILQNAKHISELKKQLKQFENIPFYSIIVFYGNSELKEINFVPEGTFVVKSRRVLEVIQKIISENPPANYTNKREIVDLLNNAVKNEEDNEVEMQHVKNVKDMLGKDRVMN